MNSQVRSSTSAWKAGLGAGLLGLSLAVYASLQPGSKAPDFTTQASLGGKVFSFSLAAALKQGPVVLYFYPAAFTKGCTVEAHEFAEATDRFKALGATVIGISHDDIDTLNKFSVSECRSKFAVAADPDLSISKAYDAKLFLIGRSDRTSYVIAPDGTVIYTYSALSPDAHVRNTMDALEKWKTQQQAKPGG
ncbi:MAG: peroxiredoxin [Nevskia sp.]|nr:peroxiredoxin [Nevskia sp.]